MSFTPLSVYGSSSDIMYDLDLVATAPNGEVVSLKRLVHHVDEAGEMLGIWMAPSGNNEKNRLYAEKAIIRVGCQSSIRQTFARRSHGSTESECICPPTIPTRLLYAHRKRVQIHYVSRSTCCLGKSRYRLQYFNENQRRTSNEWRSQDYITVPLVPRNQSYRSNG